MTEQAKTVTIDGKEYLLDELNDAAKNQLVNLRTADQKIAAMQQDLAMFQTARNSYAKVLAENLPVKDEAVESK